MLHGVVASEMPLNNNHQTKKCIKKLQNENPSASHSCNASELPQADKKVHQDLAEWMPSSIHL
jgi:hypothetical protein